MNRYYVKSMGLAAWVMANGFELISTEKTDNGYHLFWFENSKEFQDCMECYYEQEMLQKYIQANIKLKKLMYGELREVNQYNNKTL